MCGICGIVYGERERLPDRFELTRMTQALGHRGPDDEGFTVEPGVGLGHRRLSVIDIPGGAQPMTDPNNQVSIVYNGEIYNFRELRAALESFGHVFRTNCDTEVLLNGYLEWGLGIIDRAIGMFALAIWDRRTEELFLVRDRLGVKPLYWSALAGEQGMVFGSELSALQACADVPSNLNRAAICSYLALSYISGETSAIERVYRVPPGCYVHWRRGGVPETKRYWDLAAIWTERAHARHDRTEVESEFVAQLQDAVRRRLISDVPLGGLLSGGLDSSIVCALMQEHTSHLETFSVGFKEATFDELPFARMMAEHLGADHHDTEMVCEAPDLLLEVAGHLDEPFADTSILPTYQLCRFARTRLTVALSGDGGDELLAGYPTHVADAIHRYVRHLPGPLLRLLAPLVNMLPDTRTKVGVIFKLKQFMRGAPLSPERAHASWRMLTDTAGLRRLVRDDFWSDDADPFSASMRAYADVPDLQPLDRNLYVDYKTWLVDDILVKVDRASMAHGLEVRSPFLDHPLVEYCSGLPARYKLRRFRGKYILGEVAASRVPDSIIHRPKRGFNAPVSHWISGPWRELVHDSLSESNLKNSGILNPAAVLSLLEEHQTGRRDHGMLLFNIVMLRLWQETRPAS